jgi:peptidoglycan biosynthesis protein MviN/MurJ (putative lipid II flippase)
MAFGTLVGGFLQFAVQWPSLRRAGFRYRPMFDLNDPGVRQIMRLMGPAIIGTAAVQINVFVNTNFASEIVDPATGAVLNGPVSWLSYAFRFMQFPIGVFGVAIATAALPAPVPQHQQSRLRRVSSDPGAFTRAGFSSVHPLGGRSGRFRSAHRRARFRAR